MVPVMHVHVYVYVQVQYVLMLFADLKRKYPQYASSGIGVIAPYKAQRRALTVAFRERWGADVDVEISTVDGFQGREKDIIIFSCVRAPQSALSSPPTLSQFLDPNASASSSLSSSSSASSSVGIGFLSEWQRLNVAITRAKYGLWVVGHGDTLKTDKGWSSFIDYARQNRSDSMYDDDEHDDADDNDDDGVDDYDYDNEHGEYNYDKNYYDEYDDEHDDSEPAS